MCLCASACPVCPACVPAPPGVFLPVVCPRVPCVPCVSRLQPVSFYRYPVPGTGTVPVSSITRAHIHTPEDTGIRATFFLTGLFRLQFHTGPGLRPLSRPLIRSSRGRSGAVVGWDGCEVRLCVRVPVCVPAPPGVFLPVCPVCVPAPPGVFLPVPGYGVCPGSPRCLFTGYGGP